MATTRHWAKVGRQAAGVLAAGPWQRALCHLHSIPVLLMASQCLVVLAASARAHEVARRELPRNYEYSASFSSQKWKPRVPKPG